MNRFFIPKSQVLRLSVLYAAVDGVDAIRLPHLKADLGVWEYVEASALYIFGNATGDPSQSGRIAFLII